MRTKQKYILKRILFTVGAFIDFSLILYFFVADIASIIDFPNAIGIFFKGVFEVIFFVPAEIFSLSIGMDEPNYAMSIYITMVLCLLVAVLMWIFFRKETKIYTRIVLTLMPFISYGCLYAIQPELWHELRVVRYFMPIIMLGFAVVTVLAAVKYPKYIPPDD